LVQSPIAHASNFSTPDCKKINKALLVRVIVICSGHKPLWRDSYKGVGQPSTSPESVLHKIIFIIIVIRETYLENPVMTFPIKKRIQTELLIDRTTALFIGSELGL